MWSSRLLRTAFATRGRSFGRSSKVELFVIQTTSQSGLYDHGVGNTSYRSLVSRTMPLDMPVKIIQVRCFNLYAILSLMTCSIIQ
jgi:hypothetical protein